MYFNLSKNTTSIKNKRKKINSLDKLETLKEVIKKN